MNFVGQPEQSTQSTKISKSKQVLLAFLALFFVVSLSACSATTTAIPPEICTAYEDVLFTIQLLGGVFVVVGILMMAFKKALSSIIPSQGAQTGAIATALGIGVVLLAFATQWGNQMLTIFALPNLYELCGLV